MPAPTWGRTMWCHHPRVADSGESRKSCCFLTCHNTSRPTHGGPEPPLGPKVRPSVGLMSAIKAPDPWVVVGARCGRWRGMADLARNAPNRSFSSTLPRPMPATHPGPSPPPQRHPARPRRRAERPDTRCGPEVALTPPARGAAAPNLANLAVSCPVTPRPVRRAGALSHPLARKCAPGMRPGRPRVQGARGAIGWHHQRGACKWPLLLLSLSNEQNLNNQFNRSLFSN